MMKRIKHGLRWFFLPGRGARWYRWLLPFGTLAVAFVVLFSGGAQVWEYTNSPQFCGTTCHTMPPEYSAYQISPHARILVRRMPHRARLHGRRLCPPQSRRPQARRRHHHAELSIPHARR